VRQQRHRQPTGETVLTKWVGHFVVVKYLAGPALPADPEDPRGLAVEQPEARSGIFHLQRFGQLGIEVSNEMEDGMLNRVTFIPWGRCSPSAAPRRQRGHREEAGLLGSRWLRSLCATMSESGTNPLVHPEE
jgi:hypothetical protein